MRGVPRERRAISAAASSCSVTPRMRAERRTISSMSLVRIEVEPVHDPEAGPQGRRQQPGSCRRANQRELLQGTFTDRAPGPWPMTMSSS